jgi:hypothetical protein
MKARALESSPGQLFNLRRDPAMRRTRKGRSLIAVDRIRPAASVLSYLLGGIASVMPLPGSVAAGGSLAGNDISNSSESCRSSSFLDFCRFASFLAFCSRFALTILSSNEFKWIR